MATNDLAGVTQKLKQNHVRFVCSDLVAVPKEQLSFPRGVLVSDPDGHNLLLV
jgi:hypothetical protein